jgi:RNA polymerase sigma-70 factor (ECF subfamily)
MLRLRRRPVEPESETRAIDDESLVAAAQLDPTRFTAIYTRYLDAVYRYCYVRLGSHEAAEDATSEIFLKALAGLPGYRGGMFAAWLFRIAHNVVTDHYRRRRPSASIDSASEFADPAALPEEEVIAEGERAAVLDALARLPDDQRHVIELQLAGWTGEQIASAIGRSHGATRMLRLRAVQHLRALLVDRPTPIQGGAF